jgi:hypothetical protein
MRRRCSRSTATVDASSAIARRPCDVFGSPTTTVPLVCVIVCTTRTRRESRSRSFHLSPSASPRRIPVVANRCHNACMRSETALDASRKFRSVAASHASSPPNFWPTRGGSAASAGFRASRPQRTASLKARWRIVCTYETVRELRPGGGAPAVQRPARRSSDANVSFVMWSASANASRSCSAVAARVCPSPRSCSARETTSVE